MHRYDALFRISLLTLLAFLSGYLTTLLSLPRTLTLLGGLAVLPILVMVLYWKPHKKALSALACWSDRLGAGDLTAPPPTQGGLQAIAPRLTAMTRNLDKNIAEFILAANQTCLAGSTLGTCAKEAAGNASNQADQTHRISSAAEQVSVAVRQIAANAEAVSAGASAAMERARREQQQATEAEQAAQRVMRQTEDLGASIQGLGERLTEITGIVTMIRGVANQTNLLALNASIEAARAGAHGRGFAVVANEVKSLAAHTLSATDDIGARIHRFQEETAATVAATTDTLSQVQTSAEGLARVGQGMNAMVDSFTSAHAQVEEITLSVQEQQNAVHGLSSSIEQVAELAGDMDSTARGVHDEARHLTGISDELLPLLGGFRLVAHKRALQTVSEACNDSGVKSGDRDNMESSLRQMIADCGFLELLYVTDGRGRQTTSNIFDSRTMQASYGSDGYNMDWSQRPWFQDVMDKGCCTVTPFYRSAATHRFCFTVAGPIRDQSGTIQGVLGADIDVAALLSD